MKTKSPGAFYYEMFNECAEYADKTWILKNLIAVGEDSTWFGPPGSMKSALLLDIAVSIAMRRDWCGHEYDRYSESEEDAAWLEEPRGVIYFALERGGLVRERIGAYNMRNANFPMPIALIERTINLLDPTCADQIIATVEDFEERTMVRVGLLIIDTFSKAIANGDEDKAQTQNLAAANLARVHESLEVHIATIGHTGKNAKAGERGSNARLGHVDLAVQISGDGNVRTATVVKANAQPERPIASFGTEQVTVTRKRDDGTDRKPYTTHIVAPRTPAAAPKCRSKLSPKQTEALDALRRAIAERGDQDGYVQAEYWKEELVKIGRIKPDDKNDRTTFRRIQDSVSQQIIEIDGLVRIAHQPPPYL